MINLEPHLQRQLHWIGAADGKTPIVFAIDTAMLGVLAALVPAKDGWLLLLGIMASFTALLLLTSIATLIVGAFPRTTGPKGSLLFFGGISDHDEEDFVAKITRATEDDLHRDYARQIYRNASIARLKYSCIKLAMALMFLAVIPWLLSVSLMY